MNQAQTKEHRHFPMLWLLTGIVSLLVAFAAVFEIDKSVRAQGQVIPGSRTQVVQAVDGGMLIALHVKEGDRINAGQALAELEPDRAKAGFSQAQAEVASKEIGLIRARAELSDDSPRYSQEYQQAWPQFIDAQMGIYHQRKRSLEEQLSTLSEALGLAQDELAMSERLYQSGDISKSEVMRAQRQVLELQARLYDIRNKVFQEIRTEVARLEDELSASQHKLAERKNVLEHTLLVAPMDGVVKYVRITTVGGVLKPGDELMQISPVDDELLAEIKVNPADVGDLRQGLPVSLRFDAFDSSIYGNLHGVLRYISPDTLSEQGSNGQEQVYYRGLVAISWPTVEAQGEHRIRPQDIKPGMTATADVLTGKRTILYYLAKPIVRAFSGALTER